MKRSQPVTGPYPKWRNFRKINNQI
jgi:hypothetical protein